MISLISLQRKLHLLLLTMTHAYKERSRTLLPRTGTKVADLDRTQYHESVAKTFADSRAPVMNGGTPLVKPPNQRSIYGSDWLRNGHI